MLLSYSVSEILSTVETQHLNFDFKYGTEISQLQLKW